MERPNLKEIEIEYRIQTATKNSLLEIGINRSLKQECLLKVAQGKCETLRWILGK